jgi:hypothetical protein
METASAATFEFEIIPDDQTIEPFRVEAGMRDLRMWEKLHRGRGLGLLGDKSSITATIMFEIAYSAARRQGKIPNTMTGDLFADTHELNILDDEPVPAPPAPDVEAGEDVDPAAGAPGFTR